MHQEIEFICKNFLLESNIAWETPIAHILPWMPTFTSIGDSCLKGARGYSTLGLLANLKQTGKVKWSVPNQGNKS
jgi:hypothetical protein